jgi:hypothetical protein
VERTTYLYSFYMQTTIGGAERLFGKTWGPKPANAGSGNERLCADIGQLQVELDWLKMESRLIQ